MVTPQPLSRMRTGFIFNEADLSDDFNHTLGNIIKVTQESEGGREGTEAEVTIFP